MQGKIAMSAQDTISYKEMRPDGICIVKDNYFTKTIQFYEQNRTIPDIYLVAEMAKFFNVSCDYILGVVNTPIPLDEREAEAKDHIYMPKEFMKNKETRRTYKTIVDYVKMVQEMK